ncbi:MAG TPA: RNA polymerase sigma factor [Candidatus Limnocylindria bacterium]|jgi:RNA polymerase sigma-70 factor (ECF subfamily)|nr:RNA polymerase sigma factor [Candidatus Limnocylindria bacterium]
MERSEWQSIYEESFPRVFRALVAIGARADEAEDALHDAFAAGLSRDHQIDRIDGWLFVVASRRWRRRRVRDAIFRPLARAGSAPSPDGERVDLLSELRRLPLRQRQVIAARYLLGLSQDEIATALGIARGTVGALTSQGLARLRERIGVR